MNGEDGKRERGECNPTSLKSSSDQLSGLLFKLSHEGGVYRHQIKAVTFREVCNMFSWFCVRVKHLQLHGQAYRLRGDILRISVSGSGRKGKGLIGFLASKRIFHPRESPDSSCFGNRPLTILDSLESLLACDVEWHQYAESSISFSRQDANYSFLFKVTSKGHPPCN